VFLQNSRRGYFPELTNEFSIRKPVELVHGTVDQVHDISAWVHGTSLNVSRSSDDLRPGLNEPKGYLALQILAIDDGMDDPRLLGWLGRHDRGGVPSPRWQITRVGRYWCSGPLNMVRCLATTSRRRGELVLLTLGRRRVMVAASDGGAPSSPPRVNVQWLQGFSGLQNWWAAVVTAPWTHGILQLWWESVEDSVWWWWLGF
jgi:hypothetical protein